MSTPTQPWTWYAHGALAFGVSLLMALILPDGIPAGAGGSLGVLLYYVWREERDERAHKEASDWRTPDEHGVTPFIDKYGDLIGPIFNTLAWHAALLVTMIR